MCYFSDEERRKTLKGNLEDTNIEKIAQALFHRALKIQIGCGAEPTCSNSIPQLISLAKKYKAPYISLTTNGLLLSKENIYEYISEGLNEITLSMHGVKKETYEYFMTNGNYDTFRQVLKHLSDAKNTFPDFKIRINYTMNEDNLLELIDFFDILDDIKIDFLQLRPIQKIGNTIYHNFSHNHLEEMYDTTIKVVREKCRERNITCIVPTKIDISDATENTNSVIVNSTYCYISPNTCWRSDFDYNTDTHESYSKRKKLSRQLLKNVFFWKKNSKVNKKNLNYNIS
jgi:molybdenum cofactor biosynthesis enzyme MoaA